MNEIILEVSAFVITLFCFMDCIRNRKSLYFPFPKGFRNKIVNQHSIYLMMLVTLMISALSSFLEVMAESYAAFKSVVLLYVLNEIYFLFHTILSALFALYIINMTGVGKEKGNLFMALFLSPLMIGEILVLINPFTGILFYINDNVAYSRGDYMWLLYAVAGIYVILGAVFFVMYRKRLSRMDRSSTLILIFIAIFGIIIQGAFSIMVELFFEAIGFLGFLILLEDRRIRDRSGRSRRLSKSFIFVIALIFVTVIIININLIFQAGTDQTDKIGTIQINNIRGDLQEEISGAESDLLRFSMGIEQLINDEAGLNELERYINEQRDYYNEISGGNCYNVYAASGDWTIIPNFDMPKEYHAVERIWYTGAKQNAGRVYISEPYIDAATGELCYTISNILSDNDVVTAMDFTLSNIQNSVEKMITNDEQLAFIATDAGYLVGCSQAKLRGEKIEDALPNYKEVFERVKASNEHRSFNTRIEGNNVIVFSSETGNGWHLILCVDSDKFYYEIYREMIMLGAIDLLMVAVIIVFYTLTINNQEKMENTLVATESFLSGLSTKLKVPVRNIISMSEEQLKSESSDSQGALKDIRENGMRLRENLDNLFSYSNILRENMYEDGSQKQKKADSSSVKSTYIRNGVIGTLIFALLIGFLLCVSAYARWGSMRLNKEADKYNSEITLWIEQHQRILGMFVDVITADPSVLDDYDSAVGWMNDIAANYSDISACYIANPYREHSVIMNNGWVPEPDYRVEERQWYLDTERSGSGSSISAPYFDAQTGLYCITFSRIVYSKEGEFLGIFAIDCYIDKLIDVLDDSYSADGYAFMVDQDGTIINHPNKRYEMSMDSSTNIEDTEYVDVYHHGREYGIKDYDGNYVACFSEKSELSGFSVIVVRSWWSIYGTVVIVALIYVFVLVASVIAVSVLIKRFIRFQEETNVKLIEAADNAAAAGKAKSRFLAQMSHEIRTPINAVLGMNEMILRESKERDIRDYATNIKSSGKNLLALINSILDFSKIEEGKMEIIPVRYDTAAMIDNIVNSISGRAADKGLTFEAHVDEKLPSFLFGDDMRISQVAMNLLTNAVKYTKEGRVDLYIEETERKNDTISILFRVVDTGIGIKAEDMDKLYESFTRLDEERNRSIEGTGLGMTIVVRLLQMMGSRLNVTSEYRKGSDFSFIIDQTILDETEIGNYEEKAKVGADRENSDRYVYAPEAKLLVVDDNDMNIKVIKNLLKLNGIVPDSVDSGMDALNALSQNRYDIVLLDHMMPRMDGIETLKKAKEEGLIQAGTTVVALTANAVVGARETYLEAGFDDYLSKPVEVKALEHVLRQYLPEDIVELKTIDQPEEEEKTEPDDLKTSVDDEIIEFLPQDETGMTDDKNSDKSVFEELDQRGIDTQKGLFYCGKDKDFYRDILTDYMNSSERRLSELDQALANEDMSEYSIKVHSLKSTAKTVGDSEVFEKARELEFASKEGDIDKVRNGHGPLKDEYIKKADIIRELL